VSTAAPEVEKRGRRIQLAPPGLRRPRVDLGCLVLVLIIALAAPLIVTALGLDAPQVRDPHAVNLFGNPTGPGGSHPLGVDGAGRDVLSRLLYGLRSLVLISLAASALAIVASAALAALARLNPWLAWLGDQLVATLGAFPALLLGLTLGLSLGGVWRLIVPIALVALVSLTTARELPGAGALALSRALGLDVGLTFLGVGPGGRGPQLGAMIAQAGDGVLAGVPAWWALVFPGLAVVLVLIAAQSLARGLAPGTAPAGALAPARSLAPAGGAAEARSPAKIGSRPLAGQLAGGLVQLILAVALAAAAFTALAGRNPGGASALAGVGGDLGASGSLLLGGLVVWGLAVWLSLMLSTRPTRTAHTLRLAPLALLRRRRIAHTLRLAPPALLAAAPTGWLAFLTLYVFSESVGKLPILPGAGTYVGLTHDAGRWAQSLIMPWLVLGLGAAAWTRLSLDRAMAGAVASAQQRVARAAGVPERTLARQRRRALWAPLLTGVRQALPGFVGGALLIEVTYRIPGAGTAVLVAFEHRQAATVSDLTLLVSVALIGASVGLGTLAIVADPRAARR
jgi:ABC-type dipeptide/oligopeptide/nickel transport system permease subunit